MPAIIALEKLRQEDFCEFETSLCYIRYSRLAGATDRYCLKKPVFKIKKKNETKTNNLNVSIVVV